MRSSFILDGEEFVILSRTDYDALSRAAGALDEDDLEERIGAEIHARYREDLEHGRAVALPRSCWDAIHAGEAPLRVVRRWRGHTQAELARMAGLAQSQIADIERGARVGTAPALKRLAEALAVSLDVLAARF